MEHIINPRTGAIDFGRYSTYLESIRKNLPAHVYAFASNSSHFDLTSLESLHDAWLETISVREVGSAERSQIRRIEIDLCLLGPSHDRRIHLHYMGVVRYRLDTPYGEYSRFQLTGHGDLMAHEIRLGGEGLFIHELLFERDATILVECSDLHHSQELINQV